MDDCCIDKAGAIERLRKRQAETLRLVLLANAAMFGIELISGLFAGSVALLADSLDMLGDALVYGFSLYVVARRSHLESTGRVGKGGGNGPLRNVRDRATLAQSHLPASSALEAWA
jgi:Cation efflux family